MRVRKLLTIWLAAALLCGVSATAYVSAQQKAAQAQTPSDGVPRITIEEFRQLRASKNPPFVIDVRAGATQKITGAHVIPLDSLEAHLDHIPRDAEIVTYCA